MGKYPDELINAIKNDRLVLFVGAGMSSKICNKNNDPISDWQNLVKQLLEEFKKKIKDTKLNEKFVALSSLVEKISPIDILYIIEKIKDENESNSLIDEIIQNFLITFFALSPDNNYREHQHLWKLSKKIITTNFDRALENGFESLKIRPELRVCYDKNASFLRSWFNLDDYTLLKIHGCINNPETLIIFPSQYNSLYNRRQVGENVNEGKPDDKQQILFHFQNIITNYTILFLGYSMSDIDINNIFDRIKKMLRNPSKKHFIISPNEKIEERFKFLERIPVDGKFDQLSQIIRELLTKKHGSTDFQRISKDLVKIQTEFESKEKKLLSITDDLEKSKNQIELLSLELYKNGLEDHKNGRYENAIRNFEIANKIQPNNSNIYNSWANILVDLAKMEENEDVKMYQDSFDKFKKATDIDTKNENAFVDWGNTLCELAEIVKTNTDREKYIKEAFEKYKKAIEINGSNDKAFYFWVIAIIYLCEICNSKTLGDSLFENLSKYDNYKKGIQPIENTKYYLKALCHAYTGDKEKALEKLQKALCDKEIEISAIIGTEAWEKQFATEDYKKVDEENYNKYMKLTGR